MGLLKKTGKSQSNQAVQEVLSNIEHAVGMIPKPVELITASPGLFKNYIGNITYYQNHPNLNFELLLFLRYLVARKNDLTACIEFNESLLVKQGFSQSELDSYAVLTEELPLEEAEISLIDFVLAATKDQNSASREEVEHLTKRGWTEADILDATSLAFSMKASGAMLQLFKMV